MYNYSVRYRSRDTEPLNPWIELPFHDEITLYFNPAQIALLHLGEILSTAEAEYKATYRKESNMNTPGKFEACENQELAEILHNETLESFCTEECGSCQDMGWYGLLEHENRWYICETDNDGFFTYETYETEEEARITWQEIVDSYEAFYNMTEEDA